MFRIGIPEFIRRNSVTLSPVSSLIEKYHTDPKNYFEIQNKKISNTTYDNKN